MGKPFRETLWFKKGLLDAEQASAPAAADDDLHPRAADLLPIEDRYVDDGSVSLEDSKQFSVHTGCTEFVPVIAATGTSVEGVAPLVDDLKRGRRTALALIGASMTVLAILVLFAF